MTALVSATTLDDFMWGQNVLVKQGKKWIRAHTLTRFSPIQRMNFAGYMLVRMCGDSNRLVQLPLDTPAKEDECQCSVFVYGDV